MAFSYSFHLSSKGHSVSTISKIGQVSRHNLRDYKSADYDKNNIQILVGGDKTILQNMREVYRQEFDAALKKYNEGKRADRQIEDYLKHISDAKADVGAEIIVQVGDKDFWEGIDKADRRIDGLFEKQLERLQELVPEFKIASAVIHYDESSPHMHIVGVPVSEGFKKGLEKQVSKTRVFTADRLTYLQDKMRENVEECMKDYPEIFKGRRLKEKEKGRNKDIPKQKLDEYYQLEEKIISGKDEVKFWQGQSDLYMDKAIQNRDESFELQDANVRLKEELKKQESQLAANNEVLAQQAAAIEKNNDFLQKLKIKVSEWLDKIRELELRYKALEEAPPKVKMVEKIVEVPKYIDTPRYIDIEKVVEVPKIVEKEVVRYVDTPRYIDIEKVVEVPKIVEKEVVRYIDTPRYINVDEKSFYKALDAFDRAVDYIDKRYGGMDEFFDSMSESEDFLSVWKACYPRSRVRVAPITPDGLGHSPETRHR